MTRHAVLRGVQFLLDRGKRAIGGLADAFRLDRHGAHIALGLQRHDKAGNSGNEHRNLRNKCRRKYIAHLLTCLAAGGARGRGRGGDRCVVLIPCATGGSARYLGAAIVH